MERALNQVDERAEQLFKLLVETYISDGRPVASRALAGQPSVTVSPATVRNIMARLESQRLGQVAPHVRWQGAHQPGLALLRGKPAGR